MSGKAQSGLSPLLSERIDGPRIAVPVGFHPARRRSRRAAIVALQLLRCWPTGSCQPRRRFRLAPIVVPALTLGLAARAGIATAVDAAPTVGAAIASG